MGWDFAALMMALAGGATFSGMVFCQSWKVFNSPGYLGTRGYDQAVLTALLWVGAIWIWAH